jgi:NAD(P)-dependent dehydrogenase (short-subunit alcohol dehydrogenase family)
MIQTNKITKKVEGKNAAITGESSDIGPATAQRFLKEGIEL